VEGGGLVNLKIAQRFSGLLDRIMDLIAGDQIHNPILSACAYNIFKYFKNEIPHATLRAIKKKPSPFHEQSPTQIFTNICKVDLDDCSSKTPGRL
jgi:hypothetical protein